VSEGQAPAAPAPQKPAVSVKKSLTAEYIVCLEDGKKFKSLKRHLRSKYNMTPEQYRDKWNLPADYPMVAPNYAVTRSALAKKMGLGQARSAKR
jgi:predicted transcriptional regulator